MNLNDASRDEDGLLRIVGTRFDDEVERDVGHILQNLARDHVVDVNEVT